MVNDANNNRFMIEKSKSSYLVVRTLFRCFCVAEERDEICSITRALIGRTSFISTSETLLLLKKQ